MKRSYLLIILIIFIVLLLLWGSMVAIDYHRGAQRQNPLFTYMTEFVTDGGTRRFHGLGYTITFYNQTMLEDGRMDTVFRFFGIERTFPREVS